MKILRTGNLPIVLLGLLFFATGCSTTPEQFAQHVKQWVPIGTSTKQAEQIMAQHGFECLKLSKDNPFNALGSDYLGCDRQNYCLHDWSAVFFLEDGKVVKYGPVTIDEHSTEAVTPP